jgi:peptidoglycan/LPS O-acetylase OafA/YrhL
MWTIFFAMLLDVHFGKTDAVSRLLARFCNTPFMQHTGKISYSFYLVHALVMVVIRTGIAKLFPEIGKLSLCLSMTVMAFPIAYGLSIVLFKGVEQGGARLGKRIMTRKQEKLW